MGVLGIVLSLMFLPEPGSVLGEDLSDDFEPCPEWQAFY